MIPQLPLAWGIVSLTDLAVGIGGRVWRAETASGGSVVIKQISEQARDDAAHALAWLTWRQGQGAVRLLDASGDFQLLEDAGDETLGAVLEAEGDLAATRYAAEALRTLHAPGSGSVVLPSMRERFSSLTSLASPSEPLLREAQHRLERLLALPHAPQPLHGDIHHDNLLRGPRGWLAIDPHGVMGDPAYDAANLLYNPIERRDLRTSTDRARRLADLLGPAVGRPPEVVLGYAFCHACLSSVWHLEDGDRVEAEASLDVARAIHPLLDAAPGLS